jgi:hypothetical protein
MLSPILDALPAIHTTVVGIGTAFYSAFVLYAYEKLRESKAQLGEVLKDATDVSTPNIIFTQDCDDLLKENGELDWHGAKTLLWHARTLYPRRDNESGRMTVPSDFSRKPEDDDVVDTCRKVCCMFQYLFTAYPFTGRSPHIIGVSERVEERKAVPFDSERLREIERRIGYIVAYWDGYRGAIMELATNCTDLEKSRERKRLTVDFEQKIAMMSPLPPGDKESIWAEFYQPRLDFSIDYGRTLADYFKRASQFKDKVFPSLSAALSSHDKYNEEFKIKASTLFVIRLTVLILLMGVLLPLTLQNLQIDSDMKLPVWFDYSLLFVTCAPYFYVSWYLYRKVKKWSFE